MANVKKNEPDNGYKTVLKEYDFYNNTDNDFEIIEDCPKNDMNNKNDNSFEDLCQNSIIQNYILIFFQIIFNSRNQSSSFSINDIFDFDNLKPHESQIKYLIDFYIMENNNGQDKNNLSEEKKLLVERWKIKYKEDKNKSDKNYELYLNKKMKLIEKSIIAYTRLLPLYNFVKNEKYLIEFKFCPKNRRKFIDNENSTFKIKLIEDNKFCFKLSVKYLKIKAKNIIKFIEKNNSEFIVIPSKKSRRRFLSDTFHKKSSAQLLNELEKDVEENNEKINNNCIIDNYIGDERRFSYENPKSSKQYINSKFYEDNLDKSNPNKIEIKESGSIYSNEDNLSLVINESDSIIHKSKSKIMVSDNMIKTEKINRMKSKDSINEDNPRKCQTYKENHKYKHIKSNELSNLSINNAIIKSILQDYKNVRRIVNIMPDFDSINHNKLATFISNN